MRQLTWTRLGLPIFPPQPETTTLCIAISGRFAEIMLQPASGGSCWRAMEDRAELESCLGVTSATNTMVCRLTAGIETMRRRVETRESGLYQTTERARA